MASALQRLDLLADPAGVLFGVPDGTDHDFVAFVRLGPQGLAEPPTVLRDHSRGCAEDMRSRAVVLLEPSNRGTREIGLEPQDVTDLGTTPAVDRLVIVADAAQVAALLGQQAQP